MGDDVVGLSISGYGAIPVRIPTLHALLRCGLVTRVFDLPCICGWSTAKENEGIFSTGMDT